MEFLAIMTIGTVIAILVVLGSRPKRRSYSKGSNSPSRRFSPPTTPVWKKDIALSHPMGELEYLEGIERHQNDPQHEPFPLPPPRRSK